MECHKNKIWDFLFLIHKCDMWYEFPSYGFKIKQEIPEKGKKSGKTKLSQEFYICQLFQTQNLFSKTRPRSRKKRTDMSGKQH